MWQEGDAVAELSAPPLPDDVRDADLLLRARAGDETAFALLIELHIKPLQRLARGVLASEADAADVVHEALLSMWASVHDDAGTEALDPSWAVTRPYSGRRPAAPFLRGPEGEGLADCLVEVMPLIKRVESGT